MISLTSTVYPKQSHAIVQIAITVTLFSEFSDAYPVYCWLAKGQMCDGCQHQAVARHISKTKQDRSIVSMEDY